MPQFLSDLVLPRDPDDALDAATKQYVDAAGGSGTPEVYVENDPPVVAADILWVDEDSVVEPTYPAPVTYSANLSTGTTVLVTHNMGTTDVVVAVYRLSDGVEVDVPFTRTSINAITLNSAVDLAGHRVVVVASGGLVSSGGGGLQTRAVAEATTTSLAPGATWSGYVEDFAIGYRIYMVDADFPCRIRLYTDHDQRDADVSRPIGTDPTGNHGLMLEFVSTASLPTAVLSPVVDGFTTVGAHAPCNITNTGTSTATITVFLMWLRTE